jgi:hypothetical protein
MNDHRPLHVLTIVAMLLGAHVVAAQRAPSAGASGGASAVRALEDTLNAAWLRHDTITVGRLIAPDFAGITSSGRSIGRVDMLRAVAHTDEMATDVSDRTARVLGGDSDVVVTTARITDRGRRATGDAFTVETLVTNVWVRRSSGWQLVGAHESAAPPRRTGGPPHARS